MIVITFELPPKYVEKKGRGPVIVIVVLEAENLERMKQADPADLQLLDYVKGPMLNAPLKQLDMVIAYEDDLTEIMRIKESEGPWGIVKWLERGRKIIPGDVTPPVPLKSDHRKH